MLPGTANAFPGLHIDVVCGSLSRTPALFEKEGRGEFSKRMIEEKATIIETTEGFAWVETQRKSTCDACEAKTGCGTQVIGKVVGNRRNRVRVLNKIGASKGDQVVVGLNEGAMVKGSLAMYFAPLAGLFAGAALGGAITSSMGIEYQDGMQIISALLGLGVGLWWLKRFTSSIRDDERYQAVVLRRCASEVKFVEPNIKSGF